MHSRALKPSRVSVLDRPPPVEFPVGASPFHKKGISYSGTAEYVEETVAGGVAAVLRELPEDLQTFFKQTFLASAWYDFMPTLPFATAAARVAGMTTARFMTAFSAWQTQRLGQGVNRIIFSHGSV